MNRFVVANPGRCIGCFACAAACVEAHHSAGLQAYPRLTVTHTPAGTMPIQCRHCEEPCCLAACPVKAITQRAGSVALNESLCIGCKLCALACPFGAIIPGGTPIPKFEFNVGQYTYHNTPYETDPMYLREPALEERLSLISWKPGQKTVAVKCDLCYFREDGPACVAACPHQALRLIAGMDDQPARLRELARTTALEDLVKEETR
ncbi:MAG TPA: 4Fe-4S dicluster domain-containing protein [Anaerolineales bacterium]